MLAPGFEIINLHSTKQFVLVDLSVFAWTTTLGWNSGLVQAHTSRLVAFQVNPSVPSYLGRVPGFHVVAIRLR